MEWFIPFLIALLFMASDVHDYASKNDAPREQPAVTRPAEEAGE